MTLDDFKKLIREIVAEARKLSDKHTTERGMPVNYACIFTQSEIEYGEMLSLAGQMGTVVEKTTMGPVFRIASLSTEAGDLQLLKVRRPDPKRPERGDADFTVSDYPRFKEAHINKPGFALIQRADFEMIELIDPSFNVLAYYSYPTLEQVLTRSFSPARGEG